MARRRTHAAASAPVEEPLDLRATVNQSVKLPCPMCSGLGFVDGILDGDLVVPCGCTTGSRLECAVPEGTWPLHAIARGFETARLHGVAFPHGEGTGT